ncbi:MAG: polysaccharide pyruvyl transferase family protein [Sandaracinaceae bacterium]|nr:polysaccharide pyruvyl transferase family protein [Sandaracinaceae bacterium]
MSLMIKMLGRLGKAAVDTAKETADPDRLLQVAMRGLIETARLRHESDPMPKWAPGEPLRLLLAGYVGTRNTGADVRTEEMIRQFRHLFGDEHCELSICTIDPELTRGYFRTVKQLHIPQVFHKFLFDTVREQHGVIACEGSMFKSKFANALSTMMAGALGLACAEQKIAVGYGGEAGHMDPSLERFVREACKDAFVITRNVESAGVLDRLGLRTEVGTDTAWTFEAAPRETADKLLRRAGWDGKAPVLAVCPIHPFWWPVKPDPVRAALAGLSGSFPESHYKSIYFHNDAPEVERKLGTYIRSLAGAIKDFTAGHGAANHKIFTVLVGMEQLDRKACELLSEELGGDVPLFVSNEHRMYEMVAILRRASLIVSSRYHALVCSMPALVPSVGVTMDERIRNLMHDRGQPELLFTVDQEGLDEGLAAAMQRAWSEREAVQDGIGRSVVRNLERMGTMGAHLVDYVRGMHPEFPFAQGLGSGGDPWAHLPSLGPTTRALVERYAGAPSDLQGSLHA